MPSDQTSKVDGMANYSFDAEIDLSKENRNFRLQKEVSEMAFHKAGKCRRPNPIRIVPEELKYGLVTNLMYRNEQLKYQLLIPD